MRRKRLRQVRQRRHVGRFLALGLLLCVVALLAFMSGRASGPTSTRGHRAAAIPRSAQAVRSDYGIAPAPRQLSVQLKLPLRSGLLFDVGTGRLLWDRSPGEVLPIASLTKMMTALIVAGHMRPGETAPITSQTVHFSGSGVGMLPLHKSVLLTTLLYGLMLPSGNDAAIALAQRVAGTQARFVAMMNARAHVLGLSCTNFTTVSGIIDRGNHSCASDLALIAHAVLEQPLLAQIVGTHRAVVPLPIKGGKLWLYNNNPLYRLGYPGTDGVKTGYTVAAGQCLVATARRGRRWLGVVLLHSGNTGLQAQTLLNAGFAAR